MEALHRVATERLQCRCLSCRLHPFDHALKLEVAA